MLVLAAGGVVTISQPTQPLPFFPLLLILAVVVAAGMEVFLGLVAAV
jgi:hypothetical protein